MKTLILSALILFASFGLEMTVSGPTIIDIIGFDQDLNVLYFTKTNWADCGECETDLYTYYLNNDSLLIHKNWSERYEYKKHKYYVLKINDLYPIMWIDTIVPKNNPVDFYWLPREEVYNPVLMKDTLNSPFKILIQNKSFVYNQCLGQDEIPKITQFKINGKKRLVHVRYQGECYEGNTIDELIYYEYRNSDIYSRDLKLDQQLSNN
jgi:hypothetical protein